MKKYAPSVWNLTLIALVFVLTTSTFAAFAWRIQFLHLTAMGLSPALAPVSDDTSPESTPGRRSLADALGPASVTAAANHGSAGPSALNDGSFGTLRQIQQEQDMVLR